MVTGEVIADWSSPNEAQQGCEELQWLSGLSSKVKRIFLGGQKRRGNVLEQGDQDGLDVGKDVLHPVAWVGTGTQQLLIQTL